jgi:RHS repeat-associated protein
VGTYSFGARTYDPSLRRWVSPDPLFGGVPDLDATRGDNLNLYAFAGNNPVERIDPTGFENVSVRDRIWGAVGNLVGIAQGVHPVGMLSEPAMAKADVQLPSTFQEGRAAGQVFGGMAGFVSALPAAGAEGAVEGGTGGTATLVLAPAIALTGAKLVNGAVAVNVGAGKLEAARANASMGGGRAPASPSPESAPKKIDVQGPKTAETKASVGSVPKAATGKGTAPPSQRDPQRTFTKQQKVEKLAEQKGTCPGCGNKVDVSGGKGHHVKRHADGGKTTQDNHAVVCKDCHLKIHDGK